MSAISGASSSLATFLQSLQQTSSTNNTSGASGTGSASASSSTGKPSAAKRALFKQIQQAVTAALQSTGPGTDKNAAVKDAISKVLQDYGSPSSVDSDDDNDGDPGSTASTTAASKNSIESFFKTLSANGITAQQFNADLTSAVSSNGSAGASGSDLLGSLVDVIG